MNIPKIMAMKAMTRRGGIGASAFGAVMAGGPDGS